MSKRCRLWPYSVMVLGLGLLAPAGRAVEGPGEPAVEITRVAVKASAGHRDARLTLSAAIAPSWNEANVAFMVLRSYGRQNAVKTAAARGRELDVALPGSGCSLLVADLGGSEDRGFADSWRRTRRSVKAVLCQESGDPAIDLESRRRAAGVFLARAGTRDEVRPLANPATTRPGSDLPLRLYADGRLAAGVEVIAEGPRGAVSHAVSDAHGFASVSLPAAGPWRVYFRPGEDRVAELLFEVPEPWRDGGAP
jgi:hypothetical protein